MSFTLKLAKKSDQIGAPVEGYKMRVRFAGQKPVEPVVDRGVGSTHEQHVARVIGKLVKINRVFGHKAGIFDQLEPKMQFDKDGNLMNTPDIFLASVKIARNHRDCVMETPMVSGF